MLHNCDKQDIQQHAGHLAELLDNFTQEAKTLNPADQQQRTTLTTYANEIITTINNLSQHDDTDIHETLGAA